MSHSNESNKCKCSGPREQAAEWFVRIEAGQLSDEDRCEFEQWLNSDPQNNKEYQAVKCVWGELDGLKDAISTDDIRVKDSWSSKKAWNPLAVAASLALLIISGMLVMFYNPGSYETAIGETRTIHLEDDSIVRLNSGTSLSVDMTETKRTISLVRGEAYFEVAHDQARPFVVVSAGGATRAVGTQFNVYRKVSDVQVTVVEGRVEVATEGGDASILNADEMVVYRNNGHSLSAVGPIQHSDLDWLDGRLSFEAMPLIKVVNKLNRYLNTPLYIGDHSLNDLRLSGTFHIAKLEELPNLLPRLLPVSLKHSGDRVVILPSY